MRLFFGVLFHEAQQTDQTNTVSIIVFHVFNHWQVRRGVFCWLHAAECHEILQFWSQTEGVWKIMAHYKMLWRFLGQKGAMHYIM